MNAITKYFHVRAPESGLDDDFDQAIELFLLQQRDEEE